MMPGFSRLKIWHITCQLLTLPTLTWLTLTFQPSMHLTRTYRPTTCPTTTCQTTITTSSRQSEGVPLSYPRSQDQEPRYYKFSRGAPIAFYLSQAKTRNPEQSLVQNVPASLLEKLFIKGDLYILLSPSIHHSVVRMSDMTDSSLSVFCTLKHLLNVNSAG